MSDRRPTRVLVVATLAAVLVIVLAGIGASVSLWGGGSEGAAGRPAAAEPNPGGGVRPGSPGNAGEPRVPGCGEDPVAGASNLGPDTPVSSGCLIIDPVDPFDPEPVEPTPGMVDLRPVSFAKATVDADGRTITIDFWSGVEPCSVLDHVDVDAGPRVVTITLVEGRDPNAGDVACIEIAMAKRVTVVLDEPLGDRTIVDGAA
jgi:hypothetical protein